MQVVLVIAEQQRTRNAKFETRNSRRRTNEEEQQDPTSENEGGAPHMQDAGLSQESGVGAGGFC